MEAGRQTVANRATSELNPTFNDLPFGQVAIKAYLLWEQAQDAYSVRRFMKGVLESVGLKDGARGVRAGEVEVFPKQSSVGPDGWGSQAILPLAGKSIPLMLSEGEVLW